jgi:phenylpropionate dioxygenase-like ring-hydroxylating dioxygenase large terminal subunit
MASDLAPELERPDARSKITGADWTPGSFALEDAWFPISHLAHIKDHPIRRLVHSQPYYIWREKGQIRASEFRPDAPRAVPASRFTAGAGDYPTVERYGYLWAWYGDPQKADENLIPNVPFLPLQGVLPGYTRGVVRFDSCAELSLENLIDLTHADFLHANVIGDEISDDDRIEVESTSETVTMIRHCKNKSVAPIMRWVGGVRAKYQDVRATIHIHVRNHVAITFGKFRPGFDVPLFHPCVPESRYRNRLNYTFNTTKQPGLFRYVMPSSSYVISPQDNIMVRPQGPRYAQQTNRPDLHSRFDASGARYRFVMQQLIERQKKGDLAYLPDADPGREIRELIGMDWTV